MANFQSLIQEIKTQSPATRIIVSAIPPMKGIYMDKAQAIIDFNDSIIKFVNEISFSQQVTIFDNSYIDIVNDIYDYPPDGVHHTLSGKDKISTKFAEQFNLLPLNSYKNCPNLIAPSAPVYPNLSATKKPDLNNDSKNDIIWRNKATGDNVVWYMDSKVNTSGELIAKVSDLNWGIKNH